MFKCPKSVIKYALFGKNSIHNINHKPTKYLEDCNFGLCRNVLDINNGMYAKNKFHIRNK